MKRSNVIVFCFVIFIPASSSPVLHCSVIPLCLEKHLVVSFFFFFSSAPQFTVLFSHQLFPVWKEAFHVCFGPGGVWPPNRMSCYGWEKARLPPLEFIPTASVRTLDSVSPAASPFIFISSFLSLLFTFPVLSSLPDLRLLQYS